MGPKNEIRYAFVSIPKEIAKRTDLGWTAKALLGLLRFKQGDDDCIGLGVRGLAGALGVSINAIRRAVKQAKAKDLLERVGSGRKGCREIYDVRKVPSVSKTDALSEAQSKRIHSAVSETATPTVSRVNTRKDSEDCQTAETLLSLCLIDPSVKQRRAFLNALTSARRAGVPLLFVAHACLSKKTEGPPWKRIDHAIARARAVVKGVNRLGGGKHFEDLRHVIDYVGGGGNDLPGRIKTDKGTFNLSVIVRQGTTWPESAEAVTKC